MPLVWEIFSDQLFFLHHAFDVRIYSFVLMGNHFHLIASFPKGNLGDATRHFMGTTSRLISFEAKSSNHLYGSRIFRSRLGSFHYYLNAYKYLYLNPVRARLSSRVEDYRYSTMSGLVGSCQLTIPIVEDALLFDDPEQNLMWLNTMPRPEDLEAVRKALRRSDFKFGTDKNRNPHRLEQEFL